MAKTSATITFDEFLNISNGFFTHKINNEPSFYHNHTFIEISYILSGSCKQKINDTYKILSSGDILFLRPTDYHCHVETQNYLCIRRDILISISLFKSLCDFLSPTLYDDFINGKINLIQNLNNQTISNFENDIAPLSILTNNQKEDCLPIIKLFCFNIIKVLFLNNQPKLSNTPTWIQDLINSLNYKSNMNQSLDEIIKKYHYNTTYIRKTFKSYTGQTMTEYHLNNQLNYAYNLIKTTTYSIWEISEMAGFNNYSYFNKSFKTKYSVTPLQARKHYQS